MSSARSDRIHAVRIATDPINRVTANRNDSWASRMIVVCNSTPLIYLAACKSHSALRWSLRNIMVVTPQGYAPWAFIARPVGAKGYLQGRRHEGRNQRP